MLKESDKYYYTQCQMQMVVGCKLCYIFVRTSRGYVIDEILFDAEYWNNLKVCLQISTSIIYNHFKSESYFSIISLDKTSYLHK